jgi:hypothetical protein
LKELLAPFCRQLDAQPEPRALSSRVTGSRLVFISASTQTEETPGLAGQIPLAMR